VQLKNKDLLSIADLTSEEISLILDTAATMKLVMQSRSKKTTHLQGQSVVTLFYESSTRTRLSFEMASKFMGASSANIAASGSSIQKGESLLDTARTVDAMATDIMIIRHPQSGAPHLIAPHVRASVINAGDGMNEHPTQALLDLYTMRERLGALKGLEVAIIGDISHSRVARSNIYALTLMGAHVRLSGPPTLLPKDIAQTGAVVFPKAVDAAAGADVIMALRLQLERQQKALFPSISEYARFFAVDQRVLAAAKPNALIMHPGPCNHGVEMPSAVYDSPNSVINEQVQNGVAVRMAIMYLLSARRNQL
jgi:aspartate carbamoyltransferase catalytic subunit